MSRFAAAIQAVAERAPMSNSAVPIVQNRVLLIDGDGLAYYCAGNNDTDPGTARRTLMDKIESAIRAASAERARILLTARNSHKGHRYAVATVKAYQGKRAGDKPKNWYYLRDLLESGNLPYEVEQTNTLEADDLFAHYQTENTVIMSHDKDMRMIGGWHLSWVEHLLYNTGDAFSCIYGGLEYGHRWFWKQMLMGDPVDNIPGLPARRVPRAKLPGQFKNEPVGPVTAEAILNGVTTNAGALLVVKNAYANWYGDDETAVLHMLEQAVLLWLRQTDDLFDVLLPGRPMHFLNQFAGISAIKRVICDRVLNVPKAIDAVDTTQAEGHGDRDRAPDPAHEAGTPVRSVPDAVLAGGSSPRPLPCDGVHQSSPAQGLQCAAREDREQLQAVRVEEPVRVPAWVRALLARAHAPKN